MKKLGFRKFFTLSFLLMGFSSSLQADCKNCKPQHRLDNAFNYAHHHQEDNCHHHRSHCGHITEYPLAWPGTGVPGTQEIAWSPCQPNFLWLSSPTHDALAKMTLHGHAEFFSLPAGSAPHGLAFDRKEHLWVTLQNLGLLARVNTQGEIVQTIDVNLYVGNTVTNTNPHALTTSLDGKELWFTGFTPALVGKVNIKTGEVSHYLLPTPNSLPNYLAAGDDHNIWVTEYLSNKIARVTPNGVITEFDIPTPDSHPVGIAASPDKKGLWFTEETGFQLGHITFDGAITEFVVPQTQENSILSPLTFDYCGNLWTIAYINPNDPLPVGHDYVIRFDHSILAAKNGDISNVPVTYYQTPSNGTVLHRIIQGPDKNIWFTELAIDSVGKLINNPKDCPNNCCEVD